MDTINNKNDKAIYELYNDDHIVRIVINDIREDEINRLFFIKVYEDGTGKSFYYNGYSDVYEEKAIPIDKSLFDRLLIIAKKVAKSRIKVLMGEDEPIIATSDSYFEVGYAAFGQSPEEYSIGGDKVYFTGDTNVPEFDELLGIVLPNRHQKKMLLGISADSDDSISDGRMSDELDDGNDDLLGQLLPEVISDDEDDEELLGDPLPKHDYMGRVRVAASSDFLQTPKPKRNGKSICEKLREIRKKFAKDKHIEYEFKECTYDGPCAGTCPQCDKEARELSKLAGERDDSYCLDDED